MRLPEIDLSLPLLSAVFSSEERASSQVLDGLRLSVAALMLSACSGSTEGRTESGFTSDSPFHDSFDTAPATGDTSTDTGNGGSTPTVGDSSTEDTGEPIEDTQEDIPEEVPDNMTPWPTSDSLGANMASALMDAHSSFEPSGVVWDEDLGSYLLVGDGGDLAQLSPYGILENYWTLSGNLEGIAQGGGIFHMADETTSAIKGWDIATGAFTEEDCTLEDLPIEASDGFEALGFVPSEYAPEAWGTDPQGFLVAGTQLVSDLYVYPATDCGNEAVATLETTDTDVSGIHFNVKTQRLYVLHDYEDSFDVLKPDGTWVQTYDLPAGSGESSWGEQEGITLSHVECGDDYANAKADLAIADDHGGLYVWANFPVACQY